MAEPIRDEAVQMQPDISLPSEPAHPVSQYPICSLDQQHVVLGQIVSFEPLPQPHDVCWYCSTRGNEQDLYKPCMCNSFIHRACFREWRTGWINPRNYFSCPNCMYSYNIERVRPESPNTKEKIIRQFRINVAKVWLATLLVFGVLIAAIAVIAYYADRDPKNIPVGIKYLTSSVAGGWPNSNSTDIWREDFKRPDVRVWPYYTILAVLCASVGVIILFASVGCTFNESNRTQKTCDICRNCCDTSTSYSTYSVHENRCYNTFFTTTVDKFVESRHKNNDSSAGVNCTGNANPSPQRRYDSDNSCNCRNCNCTAEAFWCRSCGCNCSDSSHDGDNPSTSERNGISACVCLLVALVALILSAIAIFIIFAIHKWALFYEEVQRMLVNQQQELEGEAVVLGVNEKWRPAIHSWDPVANADECEAAGNLTIYSPSMK